MPTLKGLNDGKSRQLFEDFMYYPIIIVTLTEPDRIMKEIGKVDFK